ncbi:site-specific DNA-methyltransferase [Burkholderia pseudomallei]|uniref:site-specific DNA-methyltransferase n=1 Tax=Burkholderia pseudomallei TaxID=28450 RepID=UPI000A1CB60A|nr:DNA methyltransferase [Burkholderia pseudomallei]
MPITPAWPADRVERWPLDRLIPYARNTKTHSPAQVAEIAASMREWGWTNPVLVDEEGTIIAGHGRVLAANLLQWAEAPVMIARGWSEAQKRAYRIADNKLAEHAAWDAELLRLEVGDLSKMGYELALLGFKDGELTDLLAGRTAGLTDPDDVPETPAEPVAQLGDVWRLGAHTLACGDATDPLVVSAALGGVVPHLMVTDPPYGVEYDANWRNEADRANGKPYGARAVGKVDNDDRADWREAWALFPGDVAYIWHAGTKAGIVADSLVACGFEIRTQIVWAKQHFAISRGHYHVQHEPCWYAVRKGATGHWAGDRKQTTLWQIDKPQKSETGHSTQKPVECMRRPIENNSSPGQAVYEPFSGSGTTIIAAEMTGRICHAIELNPAYVDVAVLRWQAFTGKKATRDCDGRTFDEISAATRTDDHGRTETDTDRAQTGARQPRKTRAKRARAAA